MNAKDRWRSRAVRTNCLFWALRQFWRRGGYLGFRWADSRIPYFHWHWRPRHGRHLYHFRPLDRSVQIPWPFLRGYIQRHED